MRPDDLLNQLRKRPFVPFRLHISDGTAYDVIGPEMALVERSTLTLAAPKPGEPGVLMDVVVALLHITRLEILVRTGTTPPS
jgi:hypothetical protein